MKRIPRIWVWLLVGAGLMIFGQWSAALAWEPKDQCECIAPANPGGGWDAICRTSSAVLQKAGLVKPNVYVTNMPGGSGAVAIANVITKRKGDPNLIVAASNALTFTMSMKRTPHTYDDIIPLAQVGAEIGGYFVKADSKYKTLADLIKALKADPKAANFAGGSAPGGLDHIKSALLAKAIGVNPTQLAYVPFQGGGEALTSLLGGHTDVASLDVSEAAGQLEAGKIRCLALLSEKRSTKFKDVPTTYEQGVKVSFPIWRGLYMAPGAPADAVKFWAGAVKKMVATPQWDAERAKLGWEPTYKFGPEFAKFVKDEYVSYQALLKELGFLK
ncbi:MAG: tripartite tricarboxylate transporter substrate binding protein [Thermodesulfobacteriota bacterium]